MAENKQGTFRTTIGGQALIEGILMRGPEKDAIVVRAPEGLVTKVTERKFIKDKFPILGWPIIRGMATFLSSIVTGVKALMFSADYFPDDENAQPSKFDQWLEKMGISENGKLTKYAGDPTLFTKRGGGI